MKMRDIIHIYIYIYVYICMCACVCESAWCIHYPEHSKTKWWQLDFTRCSSDKVLGHRVTGSPALYSVTRCMTRYRHIIPAIVAFVSVRWPLNPHWHLFSYTTASNFRTVLVKALFPRRVRARSLTVDNYSYPSWTVYDARIMDNLASHSQLHCVKDCAAKPRLRTHE